jgi:hypothetical protein
MDCWNDGHTLYSTLLLSSCCLYHFQWFLDDYDGGCWNAVTVAAVAVAVAVAAVAAVADVAAVDDAAAAAAVAVVAVAAAVVADDDGGASPWHESIDAGGARDGIPLEVLVDGGGDDVPQDGKILDCGLYVDQPLMMPDWG